jgi:inorganic pyrophosphatase
VRSPPGEVLVVVEIPKGSRNKYEFDPATNRFYLDSDRAALHCRLPCPNVHPLVISA